MFTSRRCNSTPGLAADRVLRRAVVLAAAIVTAGCATYPPPPAVVPAGYPVASGVPGEMVVVPGAPVDGAWAQSPYLLPPPAVSTGVIVGGFGFYGGAGPWYPYPYYRPYMPYAYPRPYPYARPYAHPPAAGRPPAPRSGGYHRR